MNIQPRKILHGENVKYIKWEFQCIQFGYFEVTALFKINL